MEARAEEDSRFSAHIHLGHPRHLSKPGMAARIYTHNAAAAAAGEKQKQKQNSAAVSPGSPPGVRGRNAGPQQPPVRDRAAEALSWLHRSPLLPSARRLYAAASEAGATTLCRALPYYSGPAVLLLLSMPTSERGSGWWAGGGGI